MASANAAISNIGTKILPALSGLRPIDSMAFAPIKPMAKPGPSDPRPIASAFANIVRSIHVCSRHYCCFLSFWGTEIMYAIKLVNKFSIFNSQFSINFQCFNSQMFENFVIGICLEIGNWSLEILSKISTL